MTFADLTPPIAVLGDDLSAGADVAWLWVNSQRWPSWTLVDLRAEPPIPGSTLSDAEAAARPVIDPPRRAVGESEFAEVRFVVQAADPRIALGTWPRSDLGIVGEASGGLGARRLGSTTEWLLRQPSPPVMVARRGRPVLRALLCADGSSHADRAVERFATLPWAADVDVTVLAVDDGRSDADAAVATAVSRLESTVASVSADVSTGRSPHHEILALAGVIDPDLIVLGTRGLTPLRRLTLGSTASAVAHSATCSVLVARADDPNRDPQQET